MRRRPSASAGLLVLSMLSVVTAVLTPMLLRSTQAVVLAQAVQSAAYLDARLVGEGLASRGDSLASAFAAVEQVTAAVRTRGAWDGAVSGAESLDAHRYRLPDGVVEDGHFSLVQSHCAGLGLVTGRCPQKVPVPKPDPAKRGTRLTPQQGPPEALIAASVARRTAVSVGDVVTVDPGPDATLIRIVGIYDDARGAGAVLARPDRIGGATDSRPIPAVALTVSDATRVVDGWNFWSVRRLHDPVGLGEVPAIRRDLARAGRAVLSEKNAAVGGHVSTSIPGLLSRVDADQSAAAVITVAIALEALCLGWFALGTVIGRISRARAAEWGIGRTRGVARRTWLAAIFLEPTVAVVLGAVSGVVIAPVVALAVARLELGRTAAIDPTQPVVAAVAAAALLGSLVAIVAASIRSARLPLPALLRQATEPRRLSRLALVLQAGAVLVTAVVLWTVITQQQTSTTQVALLAPVLVAVVVAIGALRIAVVVVRRSTRNPSRWLTGLVVGRQLARAPSALSSAFLVVVGVALAADTLQLSLVADRLSVAQAQAAVGAGSVVDVAVPRGTDLMAAVRRADPSGRAAMAVEDLGGVGQTGANRVVAVDMPRLSAVTTWRTSWRGASPQTLPSRLDPVIRPDLVVRGTRLFLTVDDLEDGQYELRPNPSNPQIQLQAVLAAGQRWVVVPFGDLREGTLSSVGKIPCRSGCRLVSIGIKDPGQQPPAPYGASFTLTGISTDVERESTFVPWTLSGKRWRERVADSSDPSFPASASLLLAFADVRVQLDDRAGDLQPSIEPDVGPAELPALAADGARLDGFAGLPDVVFGTDLNRAPLLLHIVGRAAVLPRALNDGVLVDLSQMHRISDPSLSAATPEVWLAPGSHPAILARLRAEGLQTLTTQTLATAIAAGERRAPPRALQLSLVTAGVAVLMTLLGLIWTRIAALPAKRRAWTTLAAAGLSERRLRWLAAVDLAAPAAVAAVLGVLAGTASYLITVRRLPLLPTGVGSPPPDWTPSWLALTALTAGAVLTMAAIAAAGSVLEIRKVRR